MPISKEECFVCQGSAPGITAKRCEEHDVCVQCGVHRSNLKDIPWGHRKGFLCKPCDLENKAELIAAYDSDNHDEYEARGHILCPHCGTKHHPETEDYRGDGEEYETDCPNCDSPMKVTTHYTIEWSTRKVEP